MPPERGSSSSADALEDGSAPGIACCMASVAGMGEGGAVMSRRLEIAAAVLVVTLALAAAAGLTVYGFLHQP